MDLFKRIQDLSAIYDDDGPSATVPESRPMFNNGGMLVQPSVDGSRPGYAKQKNVGKDLITFKELVKLDLPYSEATLSNVFSSPDRNKNLKKFILREICKRRRCPRIDTLALQCSIPRSDKETKKHNM